MTTQSPDGRDVLRAVWDVQGSTGADLDEDCSPTKACRNMADVSFDGWAEDGTDLREAWRNRLEREGKLSPSGISLRDIVLGSSGSS